MIRWLQTSLFGSASGSTPSPASRTTSSSATTQASSALPVPPGFAARWESVCDGLEAALIPVARMRQGWKLEWRRGEAARLRVPKAFLSAPDDILRVLAGWTRLAMRRNTVNRRAERKLLEQRLHAWLDAHHAEDSHTVRLKNKRATRKLERLNPKGEHHDLEGVLAAVNTEYFGGSLRARITWSTRWGGLSTQSIAHDAQGEPYALLTISRGYDHPSASFEIVGGVVYHECLHIAVPPEERNGRRIVHGREFRRREREYRHYAEWLAWHKNVLPGIIRRGAKRGDR